MDQKWSVASICIVSDTLTPEDISRVLNLKEDRSYKKGDPINKRKPEGPKRQKSLWILKSDNDSSESLDRHIEKIVSIIETKIECFKELLSQCEIEISCGFSSGDGQGGVVINSDLLRRLTVIPVDIILDLYPPEG